ncbi:MAG: hypothetical protein GF411_19135 [Candidatus Lokiarchaeota archaeon]|nr:hypothetical protein [Candidatus Lokiarchaeota archaeon]
MQTFVNTLVRDLFVGSTFIVAFILFFISWGLFRKADWQISGTSGLGVYFLTFAGYSIQTNITVLYENFFPVIDNLLVNFLGAFCWMLGIILMIYFLEREQLGEKEKPIITIVANVFALISGAFSFLGVPIAFAFIGLSIAVIYVSYEYIREVIELETARKSFPQYWFAAGIALTGFINFIVLFGRTYEIYMIKNILVIFGAIAITYAWWDLPSLEDLNWLRILDRLLVIDIQTTLPILDFPFRKDSSKFKSIPTEDSDGLVVAGVMTSMETVMEEILTDSGGINEINFGNKTIIFERRPDFVCILIVDKSVREIHFRLETFALYFENQFGEIVKYAKGQADQFIGADNLVRSVFG